MSCRRILVLGLVVAVAHRFNLGGGTSNSGLEIREVGLHNWLDFKIYCQPKRHHIRIMHTLSLCIIRI